MMNIILLGAPGAGKGSVSELLVKNKNFYHLSTGNALRAMIKKNNALGKEIESILQKGQLVSDDIVNKIVESTLQELDLTQYAGVILDGYPRTINQALYLQNVLKINKVLFIKVSDDVILNRLVYRRICSGCGKIYNLKIAAFAPKNEHVCDICQKELIQRKDDHAEVIKDRLNTYYKEIAPLLEYYQKQNLVQELDGSLPLETWKQSVYSIVKEDE